MPSGGRILTGTKKQGESLLVPFYFDDCLTITALGAGESISTQVVTAEVYSGIDPNPSAIVSGAASVVNVTQVNQRIIAGVLGCIYQLLCTITTNQGNTFQQSTLLAIEPTLYGVP